MDIAGSLSRPLRGLARTARQIAAGDLRTRATPTGSAEQVEVANAFNDMTDRLVRALDAQRDFVANASHQLRTPLTGLRLRLESASMRAEDPDLKRDLVAGELETERLAKLLTNLLRLAQDGQPATAATSIALGGRGRARRGPLARPGRARRPPHRARRHGRAHVRASAGDLDTMVDNLVENALNYTAPDTPILIEWGADGRDAFIAVLDRGAGIDADEAERVFDRFYRGSASRGGAVAGTGLGLAIVDALAGRWERARRSPAVPAAAPGPSCASRPRARRRPPRRRPRRDADGDAMTRPGTLRTAILAVLGLALAVAVGLAANAISRDSIGLAPRRSARACAWRRPEPRDRDAAGAEGAPARKKATKPKRPRHDDHAAPAATTPTTTSGATTTARQGKGGSGRSGGSGSSGGIGQRRERQQRRLRRRRRRRRRLS